MAEKLPPNLTQTVNLRGNRSFTQVNYWNPRLRLLDQKFAPYGEQLPEETYTSFLTKAVAFALLHPDWKIQFVKHVYNPLF